MTDGTRRSPLTSEQRRALVSPIRLEIVGNFVHGRVMTVAELARRMGRSTTSVYHHVGILLKARLLREAGQAEGGEGRNATLYALARRTFELPYDRSPEAAVQIRQAMSAAFRMADRDLEAALDTGDFTRTGPERDLLAFRLHARLTPRALQYINHHLDEVLRVLEEAAARPELPPDAEHICSLTVALLPLRGRRSGKPGREEPRT